MKLHLGVIDQPYTNGPSKGRRKQSGTATTTGEVAKILEDKYHILEHFYEIHKEGIAQALESSIAGALETVMMGASPASEFASAEAEIERMMKDMLSSKELDRLGYPGIPTKAALTGVSHRFKHPYKKRPERPSFIDTGLFQASLKAWIE